jgi:hypothetical protein
MSLLAIPVPNAQIAVQVFVPADVTIPPSTAPVALLTSGPLVMNGVRTRISFTAAVSFSGTTDTLRTGTFTLQKDGVIMRSVQVQLPADEASAGVYREVVHIEVEDPAPTQVAHTYTILWSTSTDATMAILATNPDVGYGNLIVEEIGQTTTFVGPTFDNLRTDIGWGNDPLTVAASVRAILAERIAVDPSAELVDILVEGGGAGATWEVIVLTTVPTIPPGPIVYPTLTGMAVAATMGIEPLSHDVAILNVFNNVADEMIAWSGAGAGAGAAFLDVWLYYPAAPGPGPGLVAESLAGPNRTAAVAGPVGQRIAAPVAAPKAPVRGVTFPPATMSVHTTTPTAGRK